MIREEVFFVNKKISNAVEVAKRIKNHGENAIQGDCMSSPFRVNIIMPRRSASRTKKIEGRERRMRCVCTGAASCRDASFFFLNKNSSGAKIDMREISAVIL